MYDAIAKAFEHLDPDPEDWLTWINADDFFAPGAFSYIPVIECIEGVNWFGGNASVAFEGRPTISYDRKLPSRVIAEGLCDGQHWDFVQQEGVFFKAKSWLELDRDKEFRNFKVAGDWNLWRQLAKKNDFFQLPVNIATFVKRKGQLSETSRASYSAEIESVLPAAERTHRLKALLGNRIIRKALIPSWNSDEIAVREDNVSSTIAERLARVTTAENVPEIGQHREPLTTSAKPVDHSPNRVIRGNTAQMVVHDKDWQYPAITEKHAFTRIRSALKLPTGIRYVAFPWATLIDKIQNRAPDLEQWQQHYQRLLASIDDSCVNITSCQHILLDRHMEYLEEARINCVFWSHARRDQASKTGKVEVFPLPLYPVQVPTAVNTQEDVRNTLYSFVGAKGNSWYLTKSREWILDQLASDPRGHVIGRDLWHYEKVVYEKQIRQTLPDHVNAINTAASSEFIRVLLDSVFSLCPSGSGPNSIRLWESIGAGSIPVILADSYLPPGNPALWDAAAVFCRETPEDIKALPDRLEAIASDPAELARKRHALRQLWMLYGPDNFVYDIQRFVLRLATENGARAAHTPSVDSAAQESALRRLAESILDQDPPTRVSATAYLAASTTRLLLEPDVYAARLLGDSRFGQANERAIAVVGRDHTLAHALQRATERLTPIKGSAIGSARRPKVYLFGRHATRLPIAYAPYRALVASNIEIVERAEDADLLVAGFSIDFRDNAEIVRGLIARKPELRLVVLSEEPLWDTVWSGDYTERHSSCDGGSARLSFTFLNHVTTDLYRFDRIPYFVTTSDDYVARYMTLFERNRSISARALLENWSSAPIRMAFFAEKRDAESYDIANHERDVYGLSRYRTIVAETVTGEGILRIGSGWNGEAPRQLLPDWHLDKLTTLDRKSFIVSALENTHQRNYISEKIFDAYAVLGIPVYFAGPNHRLTEIVPQQSFLNCFGASPREAAESIANFTPDIAYAESYLGAQQALFSLFTDVEVLVAERKRLAAAIVEALQCVLDEGQQPKSSRLSGAPAMQNCPPPSRSMLTTALEMQSS
jgi:hypothetical protein